MIIYQMLALGKRPSEIQAILSKGGIEVKFPQLNYYQKKFRQLPAELQLRYLPENLDTSFAKQEVRINDDISDIQALNEKLTIAFKLTDILDIIRLKLQIKNRVAQELGQALSYNKNPPVSNVQVLNKLQLQVNEIGNQLINIPREELAEIIEGEMIDEDRREEGTSGKN